MQAGHLPRCTQLPSLTLPDTRLLDFSHAMENNAHVFRTIARTQVCSSNRCRKPGYQDEQHTHEIPHMPQPATHRPWRPGKGVSTMSETTTNSTELTSQYSTQVAGDLERNLKEQERVQGEIDALQAQLSALQQDQTVLVNIQQALGVPAAPVEPELKPEPEAVAAVPAPRKRKTSAAPSTGKQARARKSSAPARKRATKKSAAASPTAPSPSTKLVDLVREHLTGLKEPRSAAEIADSLQQQHPEREFKAKIVRLTLEGLVAKNQAQRTKQGRSVFYTTPEAAEPAAQQDESAEQPA